MSKPRPTRTPESALWRWFANVLGALTLALLAVGHALPVLHFTLVAHELCAEHGALHHVEARTESAHAPRASTRSHSLLPAAHAEHEHEHCGVVSTAAERALLPAAPEVANPDFTLGVVAVVASQRSAHRSVALLDYAPKLAPPA